MSLFKNPDFYPTPTSVLDMMSIDCLNKIVLEPSSGSGNIIDYLKLNGAKEVIACEKHPELKVISASKCKVIAEDFFSVTEDMVSHINMIVMNPPFDLGSKHILHAWTIAPEGCEIIALCNWETIKNKYNSGRASLAYIIENNGEAENLGSVFYNADRTTNVEVGLVRLFKPVISESFDYEGFYLSEDPENKDEGIVSYSKLQSIVSSYIASVKCFDEFTELSKKMNSYTSLTGFGNGFTFNISSNKQVTTKEDFSKALQKHCWKKVFELLDVDKYVTKGVLSDINKFIETRSQYPFTMRNIYKMIEIIMGTRSQIMDRAIVEAIDNFTKYTHENRYSVEGWKTNAGHMLNKKFISNYIAESGWGMKSGNMRIKSYGGNFDYLLDLTKAVCYLTRTNYDSIYKIEMSSVPRDENGDPIKVYKYFNKDGTPQESSFSYANENDFITNTWYEWGFFEFKVYKKGTGHFRFKDNSVWELLNRKYGAIKGQILPEKL